jgi:hypothetical protein
MSLGRAHFFRTITEDDGDLVERVQATVYEADGTTLIAQPLYSEKSGNETYDNPIQTTSGIIEFWLDIPRQSFTLRARSSSTVRPSWEMSSKAVVTRAG